LASHSFVVFSRRTQEGQVGEAGSLRENLSGTSRTGNSKLDHPNRQIRLKHDRNRGEKCLASLQYGNKGHGGTVQGLSSRVAEPCT